MTDQEILELIRSNQHEKAVKSLFRHFRSVQKIVHQYNGTKEDAEDIFQDALVIFYRKLEDPNFSLSSSIQTFIVAISKNLIRDKKRKLHKEERGIKELQFISSVDTNDNHDESHRKIALKAIESLGEKCLKILQGYYFQKLSMDEIAQNFGYTSSKSAKNQKYKCLERARKMVRNNKLEKTSSKSIWS